MGADVGLGFVEVEEDVALGEERGLGRVEVLGLGPALVVDVVERAGGEGDGLAGFAGDGKGDALAEAAVERAGGLALVVLFFGGEEAALAQDVFGEVRRESVAHVVEVIGRVADAELREGLGGDTAAGEVLAGAGGLGRFERLLEVLRGSLVEVEQLTANTGLTGFRGRVELTLGKGDAALLRDGADGLGEALVLKLHDKGKDIALLVAAEAVEVAVRGVDGEGAGLFLVKRAQAGEVLRAGLTQADVLADDLDDVGLRFDELGEVVGHGEHQCRAQGVSGS